MIRGEAASVSYHHAQHTQLIGRRCFGASPSVLSKRLCSNDYPIPTFGPPPTPLLVAITINNSSGHTKLYEPLIMRRTRFACGPIVVQTILGARSRLASLARIDSHLCAQR